LCSLAFDDGSKWPMHAAIVKYIGRYCKPHGEALLLVLSQAQAMTHVTNWTHGVFLGLGCYCFPVLQCLLNEYSQSFMR